MQKNKNKKIKITTYNDYIGKPDFSVKINWGTSAKSVEGSSEEDVTLKAIEQQLEQAKDELKYVDFDLAVFEDEKARLVNTEKVVDEAVKQLEEKTVEVRNEEALQAEVMNRQGEEVVQVKDVIRQDEEVMQNIEPQEMKAETEGSQLSEGMRLRNQMMRDYTVAMQGDVALSAQNASAVSFGAEMNNTGVMQNMPVFEKSNENVTTGAPKQRDLNDFMMKLAKVQPKIERNQATRTVQMSPMVESRVTQGASTLQMAQATQPLEVVRDEQSVEPVMREEYNPFSDLMKSEDSIKENTMDKQKQTKREKTKGMERWFGEHRAKRTEVEDASEAVLEAYFADQDAMAEFEAVKASMKQEQEVARKTPTTDDFDVLEVETLLENERREKQLEMVDPVMAERLGKLEADTGVNFSYLRSLLASDQDGCKTASQQDDATLVKIANTYNVMHMGDMLARNMLSRDADSVAAFHDNIVSALANYGGGA